VAISDDDLERLRRCVELAREALDDGDEPFGSILVGGDGTALYEDRNRVKDGDHTRHPEFAIAPLGRRQPDSRRPGARDRLHLRRTLPMCAAGHAWVGLGRIVYATSSEQLTQWLAEWGAPPPPVAPLPIATVAPRVDVDGPAPEFADTMKALYEAKFRA